MEIRALGMSLFAFFHYRCAGGSSGGICPAEFNEDTYASGDEHGNFLSVLHFRMQDS